MTANTHPDHDTIAAFRRQNRAVFEAAFDNLLMARQIGLMRVGTVDGTKFDANASKVRSLRYDRAGALSDNLAADIAELTAQAAASDAADPQALQAETAAVRR